MEKAAEYAPLGEFYRGREIDLKLEDYTNNENDVCHATELNRPRKDSVLFIRAAFGRSCAVTKRGRVFVWGQGFKNEVIKEPKLLFTASSGVKEL